MKKIVFYIDNMRRNGSQRVIWTLLNNFSNRTDVNVVLINDYDLSLTEAVFKEPGLIKKYVLLQKKSNVLVSNIYRVLLIRQILKNERPDVVLSFKGRSNYRMIIASVLLHLRLIVSVRNIPEFEYGKSFVKRLIANLLFLMTDGCVFQNDSQRCYFGKLINLKSTVIANPLSKRFYNNSTNGVKKYGIICTGRLEKQKNYPMIIKAFALIQNKVDDDLYIYGKGKEVDYLKALCLNEGVNTRVHFLNPVDDIEIELKKSKVYILTSYYEGMPNSLMEAMACGTACIATDSQGGGVRVLLDNDPDMIIGVDDYIGLSEKLYKILTDDQFRMKIERKVKHLANPYKEDIICQKWYEFLFVND